MEMKEMSREKIEALPKPKPAKTNEVVGVKTNQVLLNPGPQVRGLLGTGSHDLGVPEGALERSEDRRREP